MQLFGSDAEWVTDFLAALCSVQGPGRALLAHWLALYPATHLSELLRSLHQRLTMLIFTKHYIDRDIMLAAAPIGLLHEACFLYDLDDGIVPYTDFYNDAVNSRVSSPADYRRFKAAARAGAHPDSYEGFSFTTHPYLLEVELKSHILKESSSEQKKDIQRAEKVRALFDDKPSLSMKDLFLVLKIDRKNLVSSALRELNRNIANVKKPLRIQFAGEEGVDEGGLTKEFFQLVISRLFAPDYGMFRLAGTNNTLHWFNSSTLAGNQDEYRLLLCRI